MVFPEPFPCVEKDYDYTGSYNLYSLSGITQDECWEACMGDNDCLVVVYNVQTGWCYLKYGYGPKVLADELSARGCVSSMLT